MGYDADLVEVTDEVILTEYECTVCGQDMFESDCDHWPGRTYLVNGEEVLCHALFHPQRIA